MQQSLPTEIDSSRLYQQFCGELTRIQTFDGGVTCCLNLLERCFLPEAALLLWGSGPHRTVFGRSSQLDSTPDAEELQALAAGQLVVRTHNDLVQVCLAPLLARGVLTGWLAVIEPAWNADSAALLSTIAAQAGPALLMLEATPHYHQRVTQLQTLNAIGQRLSSELDFDRLLEAIYEATRRVLDASDFYIALYDGRADRLDLAYMVSGGEYLPIQDSWPATIGLAGVVIRERAPLCIDNYTAECDRRGIASYRIGGRSIGDAWLGVPLIVRDQVIGVLTICSYRERYVYNTDDVELLTTIAAQAAVAIENARLYQRSERQAIQLETLNRIGRTITSSLDAERVPSVIMRQVTDLLNVEEGSLLLEDEATGMMVFAYTTGPVGKQLLGQLLPRDAGIVGYVINSGQSVIANDVQQDDRFDGTTDRSTGYVTRRLLAVPLRGVGGVQGVIEVLNRRDNSPFTEEDRQLLEAVSDYAVIALENARRFAQIDQALARRAQELARTNDQLQHNLRSLTALNALGMAINSSLRDAEEIFSMTARGVVEMTDALGAWVFLQNNGNWSRGVNVGPIVQDVQLFAPLLQRVIATGRPELQRDDLPPHLSAIGVHQLLIVPLRATQQTLGCLCVGYADIAPPAPDRETVVLFATQAASAVESMALFTAVRNGRDQMASILASTREGIMLIGSDRRVALTNGRLLELCELESGMRLQGIGIDPFLGTWERATNYSADEWETLRRGINRVVSQQEHFVSGELNDLGPRKRFVEWAVLTVLSSGDNHGGALLVLRDISEAKESARLRQDLTHMIVHDLRSPLSSVMASIDMMARGVTGSLTETQQHVLSIANDSSVQMLEMINTLLDINRLEAGRMPLSLADCDIRVIITRAVNHLLSLAQDRAMRIQTEIADNLLPAIVDGNLIIRVLQNLLANALKFSGRGSTVRVLAYVSDQAQPSSDGQFEAHVALPEATTEPGSPRYMTLAVSDRGIGIAPKDQEKIFTKFGQVGERRGGTGLGLTFCKLVVEAHGGRLWVESVLGEGSTFFVTLPLSRTFRA